MAATCGAGRASGPRIIAVPTGPRQRTTARLCPVIPCHTLRPMAGALSIVELARRGDPQAQGQLYAEHAPAIMGYCVAFCRGDEDSAADLTQDTFVAAFAALHSLQDDEAFAGWIRVIARRNCLRWIAGREREGRALRGHAEIGAPKADHSAERLARRLLTSCPDRPLRETAELFYGDPPHTTSQIAEHLGLTVTAVTTRLHRFRAWAKVRALLELDALDEEPSR